MWTERQAENISNLSKDAMVIQAQHLLQIAAIVEQYGALLSHNMTYAIAALSSPATSTDPFGVPALSLPLTSVLLLLT
jgi:hypothetical protein